MAYSKLERIKKALKEIEYNIRLNPYDDKFDAPIGFILIDEKTSIMPNKELVIRKKGEEDRVPLHIEGSALEAEHATIEKMKRSELELRIQERTGTEQYNTLTIKKGPVQMNIKTEKSPDTANIEKLVKESENILKSWRETHIILREEQLKSICEKVTPELQEYALSCVKATVNADMNLITRFHDEEYKNRFAEGLIDIKPLLKTQGKIYDFISLGLFRKTLEMSIERYAERYITWNVIHKATLKMHTELSRDARYYENKNPEMADKLDRIARFYHEISINAGMGETRMKKLLDNVIQAYNKFRNFEYPPVDEICNGINEKMSTDYFMKNLGSIQTNLSREKK
jgi:hypothetical protein